MGWFETVKSPKLKSSKKVSNNTPSGLWKKCTHCGEIVQNSRLEDNFQVCPYCDYHFRLSAIERLNLIIDENTFSPFGENLNTSNPLGFVDKKTYDQRLQEAYTKTGLKDGTLSGHGEVNGQRVAIGIMNFQFMGGSMGVVTGEKIAMVMDYAYENKIPAIVVSCSGGARMQEGILSLMQMAKTSGTRQRLKNAGTPFISVLVDPTTGGVAASYAMLGDINITEPNSLIGFAGPRVIEQSIRQKLPDGFQRPEFLRDHGFIDRIVHRHEMKKELQFFLETFTSRNCAGRVSEAN